MKPFKYKVFRTTVDTVPWEQIERLSIPEPNSGCLLWCASVDIYGYGLMRFQYKLQKAHRLAWRSINGVIPDDLLVCHKCDVRSCVNPAHLFLGTNADNTRDRDAKGRVARNMGMASGSAKLTDDQVREIRQASGSHREVAACYSVSRALIGYIRSRKIWRHV